MLKATLLGSLRETRGLPDPAKCQMGILILQKGIEREENLKKQKEENKLVPIVIRVPKDKKTMIEKLAIKQGKSEADVVRSGIDKELNLQTYKDNLDIIIKELDGFIDAKLDPFIKSQRKILVKNLRTNAINTYLQGEILSKIFGDEMHKQFMTMLNNARKKANYFVNRDTQGMTKEDLYDFYSIGDLYRNE